MFGLSHAYDRNDINTIFIKLNTTELPEKNTNINEYVCGITFANTIFGGQPNEFLVCRKLCEARRHNHWNSVNF